MKYVPRAEISTIKEVLYPLKKKKDTTWDKRNLKDLKELKLKLIKLKEDKQKEIENQPEPFKLKQYKNIPSKFMDTEDWIIKKQKRNNPNNELNENIYIRNSSGKHYYNNKNNNLPKTLNKSASIRKLPKIQENNNKNKKNMLNNKSNNNISRISHLNNDSRSYSSINELINNNINTNSNDNTINKNNNNNIIDFNLEKELEKIPETAIDGPSLFDRHMSNSEEIEKLIKEYRQKYGDTEVLESLLKEYDEVKQKKAENNKKKIDKNEENKNNYNVNSKDDYIVNTNDNLINYEPTYENGDKKPPIPTIDDVPLILPKIYKNYVKENIQLIVDNKIPQKKYVDNNDVVENKHKNFGKVPEYIKRFEMEREWERQEKIRRKEESKYPKGTKLLSEEERIKTLNGLIKTQKELTLILEKMPITNRSINIQKRKEEIVKKLNELDKAIDMFSKKKVFVKK